MNLVSLIATVRMSTAAAASKAAVRNKIAEKLSKLSPEEKKRQSEQIFKKLLTLPAFRNSRRVSTFLSIDNEVDTEPIVRKLFEDGKECFVPRKKGMEMVKLHSMEDWENLPVTSWGIKQPKLSEKRENALETGGLDFIVVPGVAFTIDGGRLGHGGGYYDRFLSDLSTNQELPPATVAVGFTEQILSRLPLEATDYKIDLILYGGD